MTNIMQGKKNIFWKLSSKKVSAQHTRVKCIYLFLIKTSENYTQNQMDRKDINKKENNIEYNNIILGILMKFVIFNSCNFVFH